ncbi:MAG: MFS transporter [Methanoregulaceae archaeon]|nr:MFS transporter [Methanoregulaceae archaeon]
MPTYTGGNAFFVIGIVLMTGASLFASFAWSAPALILFRVVQGAGGAMIFTTSVTIVTAIFPPEQRGRALGITLASVYTGLSTGPFIGGILTTYFGWRSIFLVILPLGFLVLWVTSVKVQDERIDAHGARFDLAGSILYAVSLFGVMYGLTVVPDPVAPAWIIAGITILAYFLWWESRSESPVLDMSVFRQTSHSPSRTWLR